MNRRQFLRSTAVGAGLLATQASAHIPIFGPSTIGTGPPVIDGSSERLKETLRICPDSYGKVYVGMNDKAEVISWMTVHKDHKNRSWAQNCFWLFDGVETGVNKIKYAKVFHLWSDSRKEDTQRLIDFLDDKGGVRSMLKDGSLTDEKITDRLIAIDKEFKKSAKNLVKFSKTLFQVAS